MGIAKFPCGINILYFIIQLTTVFLFIAQSGKTEFFTKCNITLYKETKLSQTTLRDIKASSCMNECSMHDDTGYTHPLSSESNPERLEAEEGPHHARMHVDLVNLARRSLNVLS